MSSYEALRPKDYRHKGDRVIDASHAWGTPSPFTEGTKIVDLNVHPSKGAFIPKCKESCEDLQKTIGKFTAQEMEQYRSELDVKKMEAAAVKDIDEYEKNSNEIACLTAWEQCELKFMPCIDDCDQLKQFLGKSANNPKEIAFLMQERLSISEDPTRPRIEVVKAIHEFNCITRFNDLCHPRHQETKM